VTASYSYDNANELTNISYSQGNGTPIGNVTYTYDPSGARTSVGGTLASVVLPPASSASSYDANDRMTQLNGVARSYDANGSTLGDGTNVYAWDARHRLVSIQGPVSASFQYDALGRRTQRVIDGSTTGYVYDGPNYVQEQNSVGGVTAVLMAGKTDELFARETGAGISVPLVDALGSVIAETNYAQAITANYSYGPYGTTSQSGTVTGNAQQYTGRENDGTGLYYYRARYYDTNAARFVSEDPLEWRSGQANNYAYVGDNPMSATDPYGLGPNIWACTTACTLLVGYRACTTFPAKVCALCLLLGPAAESCFGYCAMNPTVNCYGVSAVACALTCSIWKLACLSSTSSQ
jgi:RHS repeat-associated protein